MILMIEKTRKIGCVYVPPLSERLKSNRAAFCLCEFQCVLFNSEQSWANQENEAELQAGFGCDRNRKLLLPAGKHCQHGCHRCR